MKKTTSLRSILGISQDDLALLLKVSRTTIGMSESSNRALPQAATQLLAEMIQYMCDASSKASCVAEQYLQKLKVVERMQKENDYLQQATTRKIKYVEEKCADYLKALKLVEFLSQRYSTKESEEAAILRTIARKASQGLKFQGFEKLFKLKLQLDLLVLEKLLLDHEVIKTTRVLENSDVSNGLQMNILQQKC
jgi:DNA-binding XRE family transcriptional regulator